VACPDIAAQAERRLILPNSSLSPITPLRETDGLASPPDTLLPATTSTGMPGLAGVRCPYSPPVGVIEIVTPRLVSPAARSMTVPRRVALRWLCN
jgi:hypothetical protein